MSANKTTTTAGATNAPAVVKKVPASEPTVTYPITKSFKVVIKPKQQTSILPETGTDTNSAEGYTNYIGSAFAGRSDVRPLGRAIFDSADEEERLMYPIVGVKRTDRDYVDKLDAYWNALMVPVDLQGLELEAGKRWNSATEWVPINPRDYILYIYCLKYHRVANSIDDVGKSPKIHFFMWTAEEERNTRREARQIKDAALKLRLELTSDIQKVTAVLTIAGEPVSSDIDDRILDFASLADEKPAQFVKIAKDTMLMDKYFIEQLVQNGILERPVNTFIHIYETLTLGSTMMESVAYIRASANLPLRRELEGKLKLKLENKL